MSYFMYNKQVPTYLFKNMLRLFLFDVKIIFWWVVTRVWYKGRCQKKLGIVVREMVS